MKLSPNQSLAGILEPVFAIRTEEDLGIGDTDGVRHSAKVAWRALALLQREIEAERALVPTSLGVPVTAKSGGSLPGTLPAYQDQENYQLTRPTNPGNSDFDDLRGYLTAWGGRKGERRAIRVGPGRRNLVICAATPACASDAHRVGGKFHDVNDCPFRRQPDDFAEDTSLDAPTKR
jgi:hypothetical protein